MKSLSRYDAWRYLLVLLSAVAATRVLLGDSIMPPRDAGEKRGVPAVVRCVHTHGGRQLLFNGEPVTEHEIRAKAEGVLRLFQKQQFEIYIVPECSLADFDTITNALGNVQWQCYILRGKGRVQRIRVDSPAEIKGGVDFLPSALEPPIWHGLSPGTTNVPPTYNRERK